MLISTSGCETLNPNLPTASDSFCTAYQRVIQAQGEGAIQALRPVKNRIAANEKTYICNCVTPRPKLCN